MTTKNEQFNADEGVMKILKAPLDLEMNLYFSNFEFIPEATYMLKYSCSCSPIRMSPNIQRQQIINTLKGTKIQPYPVVHTIIATPQLHVYDNRFLV